MSEWKTIAIGDSCEILDSQRIPLNDEQRSLIPGNIPYYGANGVQGYIDEYIFDEPLILLAEDGGNFDDYQRRPIAYKVVGKSWVNNHAHVLRANAAYSQDYIFYSLVHKNITQFVKGGTRTKLNQSDLKEITFHCPTFLPEQRKIARILCAVDAEIEKTEAAISKYQAIKQGMMHDLFTRGLDKSGRLRPRYEDAPDLYKYTELGCVPKEWEIPQIDSVAPHVGSGITPTGGSNVYKGDGVLFIRSQNVHFDGLRLEDVAFISDEMHKTMDRSKVYPNDVLLNITGASIGRCCYFPESLHEANVNQHVCVIRVEKNTCSKAIYLSAFLSSSSGQSQIDRLNAGGNRQGLNYQQLRAFRVPWPLDENEINSASRMIVSIKQKIDKENLCLSKTRLLKQALMSDLLTGNVPVKVEEEMAEVQ